MKRSGSILTTPEPARGGEDDDKAKRTATSQCWS